uniref:Uncharacterized protein n=1 Tax=Helianthus annuus TaxID=4232 RepID=A0A251SW51_HELAN
MRVSVSAYTTLLYTNDNLQRNCVTLNDNELMSYKILTSPTNTNFIRIFYTYEFGFANL